MKTLFYPKKSVYNQHAFSTFLTKVIFYYQSLISDAKARAILIYTTSSQQNLKQISTRLFYEKNIIRNTILYYNL